MKLVPSLAIVILTSAFGGLLAAQEPLASAQTKLTSLASAHRQAALAKKSVCGLHPELKAKLQVSVNGLRDAGRIVFLPSLPDNCTVTTKTGACTPSNDPDLGPSCETVISGAFYSYEGVNGESLTIGYDADEKSDASIVLVVPNGSGRNDVRLSFPGATVFTFLQGVPLQDSRGFGVTLRVLRPARQAPPREDLGPCGDEHGGPRCPERKPADPNCGEAGGPPCP